MTIQPGPELDRLVAEKVMGWRIHKRNSIYYVNAGEEDDVMRSERSATADTCGCNRFAPSTRIEHAWKVVERVTRVCSEKHWSGMPIATVFANLFQQRDILAETASDAAFQICRMALLAVANEKP